MKGNDKRTSAALPLIILLAICGDLSSQETNRSGKDILERFAPPKGYERVSYPDGSFQLFLRRFPLKPIDDPVHLYNGEVKRNPVHVSVFSMPLLKQDLIQCADAVIKLRAEYLFKERKYSEIEFSITNGMRVPFRKYAEGYRVAVTGNATAWKAGHAKGTTRPIFDEYLKFIYIYAGTASLSRESRSRPIQDIRAGDFFIRGGSPGHAVLVLDIAQDKKTGKKVMLLGQSYMPSQEFHILKSPFGISPWYYVRDDVVATPEWTFERNSLRCFE